MASAFLTRRITFAAAHRYRRPEWSDEENERVFGLCARPNYHGHSYTCEITVRGEIDPRTGMLIDVAKLDGVLALEVRDRFDHRNINVDVAEFAEGKLIPTGENLARFIYERVRAALEGGIDVTEVMVAEDSNLRCSYRGD
jgi:6-pyruvoyltetrahydropterin/6-carboxytetrahydropterin synthase